MISLGQFRRSFTKLYPNLYFRVGENKYNDKTLISELSNKENPISNWNDFATAADIKTVIEAWLNLSVDFYFEKAPGSRPRYIKIEEIELSAPIAELNAKVIDKGAVSLEYWFNDLNNIISVENSNNKCGKLLNDFPQLMSILNAELINETDNILITPKEIFGYTITSTLKNNDERTSFFIDINNNQIEFSFGNIQTIYTEIFINDDDFFGWFEENEDYGLQVGRHLWKKFIDVFDERRNDSDTEFENDFLNNFIWEFLNVVFHPYEG